MWLFRRKRTQAIHNQKIQELEKIQAETARRTINATKPIARLAKRLEQNGITLEIKRGLGGRHV